MSFEKAYTFVAQGTLTLPKNEQGFKDFDAAYDAAENFNMKNLMKDRSTLVVIKLVSAKIDD
eukprot:14336474-Heterocapsa_arctica.AAC.1